jgi:cell division protein FtsB
MDHSWLEASLALALATIFFTICFIAVGSIRKRVSRSRIYKLKSEIARLESELADARVMALRRLAERMSAEKPAIETPISEDREKARK